MIADQQRKIGKNPFNQEFSSIDQKFFKEDQINLSNTLINDKNELEKSNSLIENLIKQTHSTDYSSYSIFSEIGEDFLKHHQIILNEEAQDIDRNTIQLNTQNATYIMYPSETHKSLNPILFSIHFKIKKYGKMTFTLYGMDIDLEILSKKRMTTPIPTFIPTNDVMEDAHIRDIKINAVFYEIKNNKIIDPLNGIADMKKGLIDLPLGEKTFLNDFLRVFSIIKTSSKLSMKISDFISSLIKNNLSAIKTFMLANKEEIINFKLKRIIMGDYSLKAFKLLFDYSLYDPCIPEKFHDNFISNEEAHSTEIFNMILIAETIIN